MNGIPVASLAIPLAIAALILGTLGALGGCRGEGPERPDLVLITVERLAADRLACFGGPADAGHSVCQLGRGGFYFAWATTPGLGEASSAASALTGLGEAEHGLHDDGRSFLPDAHVTLAERLGDLGYATAAFVASPRLNRTRRLEQGFGLYEDGLASQTPPRGPLSIEASEAIEDWIARTESPWFIWVHVPAPRTPSRDGAQQDVLGELDRLVSRLARSLASGPDGPGLLFAALAGDLPPLEAPEADGPTRPRISWQSHRIPLIWRPPASERSDEAAVSFQLASLLDIAPTLAQAAGARDRSSAVASTAGGEPIASGALPDLPPAEAARPGRDLQSLLVETRGTDQARPRRLLLQTPGAEGEVGLATQSVLYARARSIDDGSGRPTPSEEISRLGARFARIPDVTTALDAGSVGGGDARLFPSPWRTDVLSPDSPVPQLEFHLARRLAVGPSKDPE